MVMEEDENTFYLFNYIKDNISSDKKYLEYIRYEINDRIYYYGNHFINHHEINLSANLDVKKYFFYFYSILRSHFSHFSDISKKKILSGSYINLDHYLSDIGYLVYSPPWFLKKNIINNWNLFIATQKTQYILSRFNFNELIKSSYLHEIREYYIKVKNVLKINNIRGYIAPHDMSCFEKIIIDVCKEENIPTLTYTHGNLHSIYNLIDENRTDSLAVWGQKSKESFIKMGWDPNKIYVAGNPKYNRVPSKYNFGFENILVLTKAVNGNQFSDKVRLSDRGNSILYLYSIQNTLQKLGIKRATFRVHPSESKRWYQKFIDNSFYIPDEMPLIDSLKQASLVIGPISSVFVESLYFEKNYVLFEPIIKGKNLLNLKLTPPIDGSDKRIPLATSEEELFYLLKNKIKVELDVFCDYVKVPFDISFIKKLIS